MRGEGFGLRFLEALDPEPEPPYSPPSVDRMWRWVCYKKIPIFYLLKGDYTPKPSSALRSGRLKVILSRALRMSFRCWERGCCRPSGRRPLPYYKPTEALHISIHFST